MPVAKKKKAEERTNIAINKPLHEEYLSVLPKGMKIKDQSEILIEDYIKLRRAEIKRGKR